MRLRNWLPFKQEVPEAKLTSEDEKAKVRRHQLELRKKLAFIATQTEVIRRTP